MFIEVFLLYVPTKYIKYINKKYALVYLLSKNLWIRERENKKFCFFKSGTLLRA